MHDDDLFSPSLSQTSRPELPAGSRPWRLGSQFYVAFFGGPLAMAAIGFLNATRLGLPRSRARQIAAAGAAAFAGAVATVLALDSDVTPRLIVAVAGVACYVVARRLQRDADRLYGLGKDEELAYDSLVGPGLLAAVVGGFGTIAVLTGLS
ncbi:MAG: hypothetical protein HOQ03_00480 [Thermoleophilia bacterium]|nr:hypothetical protein [Thermoleophilia bacterium]